ncbi:hypothetical protein B296_00050703 [Ensete ventricosum]|uniref:Pirin C-terminal domain-containing protein n=1 Tax=Ensete ventricosum TaxID=4639 RepID=A0A426YJY2_ENSVE|nr:hypothetical protein B296_00050703 [Ensete ventricosum]
MGDHKNPGFQNPRSVIKKVLARPQHEGFETVTYMLEGAFTHQDFAGHKGTVRAGDLQGKDVSRVEKHGVDVRIIAGESFGVRSPVYTQTPTMYLDFTLHPGAEVHQHIPPPWNSFVYIIEGEGVFGDPNASPTTRHHALVLSPGDGLSMWNRAARPLRFVLIGGQPLNEPIVQYGPFVMNAQAEIQQALDDYHYCKNGFEKAKNWKSQPHMN